MPIVKEFGCGVPLKTGTFFIAVFYLIGNLPPAIVLLAVVVGLPKYHPEITQDEVYASVLKFVTDYHLELSITSAIFFMEAICAACLLLGSLLEKAILVLLWVIQESVLTILLFVMEIIISIGFYKIVIKKHSAMDDTFFYAAVALSIPNAIFTGVLTVYFLLVVYSYYQSLSENQRAN